MKLMDHDVTKLRVKGSVLYRCEPAGRRPIKIKFSHAFWCMYPVLFYYAYTGILW